MKPNTIKRQKRIHQKSVLKKRISEVYRRTLDERTVLTHSPLRVTYFLECWTPRFCYCNEGKKNLTFIHHDIQSYKRYERDWWYENVSHKTKKREYSACDYDSDPGILSDDWIVGWLYGEIQGLDEYDDLSTPNLFKTYRKKFNKRL